MNTLELTHEKKFTKCGIDFITFERNGSYIGRASKLLKSGRTKHLFAYKFATEAARDTYIDKYIATLVKDTEAKEAAKQMAKQAAKSNPFKVGDVLVSSWGFEQTNIDFYQIVEVSGQQIKYQEIARESVIGSDGFMSEKVMFVKDEFVSDEVYTKRLITKAGSDKVYQYVNDPMGHWMGIAEPRGYYRSWYA